MRTAIGMLAVLAAGLAASGAEIVFDTPSDDRWHYPYNFTPGVRPTASCFGSTGDPEYTTFNDRDGIFLIAWRPDESFCGGLPPGAYDIRAVRVTLTAAACSACPTPDWIVDLTPDPWFNMDYPITDADLGQPLELFGVGFGPEYTANTWNERSIYVGGDFESGFSDRDPFPFVFDDDGVTVHVEDSVKDHFTPTPWAIGVPVGYSPGSQSTPFPVHFDVDLSLSEERVRGYFRQQLSGGRIFVAVTSLTITSKQAASGYPSFITKEGIGLHPLARAPQLVLTLAASGNPDGDADRDKKDWGALADCLAGPDETPAEFGNLTAGECLCVFDFDEDEDVDLQDAAEFAIRMGAL